jgi:hypothetical protein
LAKAISTRELSYRLLLWISDAIGNGEIFPTRVAHHSSGPAAATEWLRSNYCYIPPELRPPERDLVEFAAFFSTYLTSSFDVVEKPGTKGEGPTPRFGCRCELCMRIVNAPHLQAKKLYSADKLRADELMVECVRQLATDNSLTIDEQVAMQLVKDEKTRRAAAFVTYAHWLILRLAGQSDGPAVLALWRLIAWNPQGGMRRGFTLRLEDFPSAERTLLAAIRNVKR